jgi:hypothetical protein
MASEIWTKFYLLSAVVRLWRLRILLEQLIETLYRVYTKWRAMIVYSETTDFSITFYGVIYET